MIRHCFPKMTERDGMECPRHAASQTREPRDQSEGTDDGKSGWFQISTAHEYTPEDERHPQVENTAVLTGPIVLNDPVLSCGHC
jgi:hypothetical protein